MSKVIAFLFITFIFVQNNANAQSCSNALEDALSQYPTILTQPRDQDPNIDISTTCISASMDTFYQWTDSVHQEKVQLNQTSIGYYGYCENSQQETVKRMHTPPCQSENYIHIIQNAYNDVLKCLNLNPKKLFAITAVESGFHVNTYSLSGKDIGIGQLTPVAITEVNAFWDDSLAQIKESTNPFCQNLAPLIADLTSAPTVGANQTCSMMALPENPIRNLLYKGLLQQFHEKKIKKYFDESKMHERLQKLTGNLWTQAELESLQELLVFLSYNVGENVAKDHFESFLSSRQLNTTDWDSLYKDLYVFYIDYYLQAMEMQAQGKTSKADYFLNERKDVYEDMVTLREQQQNTFMDKSLFFAENKTGSFGEYLLKIKKADYLDILLSRIEYIEKDMLNSPGLCAPSGFLKGP